MVCQTVARSCHMPCPPHDMERIRIWRMACFGLVVRNAGAKPCAKKSLTCRITGPNMPCPRSMPVRYGFSNAIYPPAGKPTRPLLSPISTLLARPQYKKYLVFLGKITKSTFCAPCEQDSCSHGACRGHFGKHVRARFLSRPVLDDLQENAHNSGARAAGSACGTA